MGAGSAIPVTIPVPGMRSWESHTESMAAVGGTASFLTATSVEEFATSPLDFTEASNLVSDCSALIANGSGTGVCSCGAGDNASSHSPRSSNVR